MVMSYIALGSNLADPIIQIKKAFDSLKKLPNSQFVKQSSLYKTAPVGYDDTKIAEIPDFINAVVSINTTLSASQLLEEILKIEDQAGRLRPYHFAPRVLDCDLLLYDDETIQTKKLTLPHPRMHERGFVLLPLFEIQPHLILPKHGKIAALITPELTYGVQKLPI